MTGFTHPHSAAADEEIVTVPQLRRFIESQHRAFINVQITALIAMGCIAVTVGMQAVPLIAGELALWGWIGLVFVVLVSAVMVASIVLALQRTALVREVVTAPVVVGVEE